MSGYGTCLAKATACSTESVSSRRPKPPPRYWLCSTTLSAASPVIFAATLTQRAGTCVPTQISHPSGRTCTVVLSGSMVACASIGRS